MVNKPFYVVIHFYYRYLEIRQTEEDMAKHITVDISNVALELTKIYFAHSDNHNQTFITHIFNFYCDEVCKTAEKDRDYKQEVPHATN